MPTDTVVRARIDPETKKLATAALEAMGLSISDYIRMSLVRVAREKAIPFDVRVPNALTAETIGKSEQGDDIHSAKDFDDLVFRLDL